MNAKDILEKAVSDSAAAMADGLDVSDLAVLIKGGVEVAEALDDVPSEAKRQLALDYASELLDEFWSSATPKMREAIADLDIPWVPEGVEAAVIDPIIAAYAPAILKHFIKLALPSLVDLVVSASKGGININRETDTE